MKKNPIVSTPDPKMDFYIITVDINGPDAHRMAAYIHDLFWGGSVSVKLMYGTHPEHYVARILVAADSMVTAINMAANAISPVAIDLHNNLEWNFTVSINGTTQVNHMTMLGELLQDDEAAHNYLHILVHGFHPGGDDDYDPDSAPDQLAIDGEEEENDLKDDNDDDGDDESMSMFTPPA